MTTPAAKPKLEPRFDEKIAKAAPFAQPVLKHFRKLVHQACPDVEEAIKWQMPFFLRKGRNMCHMAPFKSHCIIGFWHPKMEAVIETAGFGGRGSEAAGLFGRLTSLDDLPSDAVMLKLIAEAAALNEDGKPARPRPANQPKRPEAAVPDDLKALLEKNKKATESFAKFSPSHRREYIEWIAAAKREETREKRVAATIELLAEAKSLHWKHQTPRK